jgi:hypothetical protein
MGADRDGRGAGRSDHPRNVVRWHATGQHRLSLAVARREGFQRLGREWPRRRIPDRRIIARLDAGEIRLHLQLQAAVLPNVRDPSRRAKASDVVEVAQQRACCGNRIGRFRSITCRARSLRSLSLRAEPYVNQEPQILARAVNWSQRHDPMSRS